jgi:hypothetical protein
VEDITIMKHLTKTVADISRGVSFLKKMSMKFRRGETVSSKLLHLSSDFVNKNALYVFI